MTPVTEECHSGLLVVVDLLSHPVVPVPGVDFGLSSSSLLNIGCLLFLVLLNMILLCLVSGYETKVDIPVFLRGGRMDTR